MDYTVTGRRILELVRRRSTKITNCLEVHVGQAAGRLVAAPRHDLRVKRPLRSPRSIAGHGEQSGGWP